MDNGQFFQVIESSNFQILKLRNSETQKRET